MSTTYPIAEMIESALATLEADLPAHEDTEQVELVLEHVGDALRAGLPISRAIVTWTDRLSRDALADIAQRWTARLSSAVLPGSDAETDVLCTASVLRDRSESVLVALRRACIGAGRALSEVSAVDEMREAQSAFDEQLRAHVSRGATEAALGMRRGLLARGSWTDGLDERDTVAGDAEAVLMVGSASGAEPCDSTVAAYVADGRHASWVETAANRSPAFAEELATLIDVLRTEGESVCLVARRWQSRRSAEPAVSVGLSLREAAADADAERVAMQLGILAPTQAEARMIVEAGQVTVRVLAEPGSLRSVRLGPTLRERGSGADDSAWAVSCPWSDEPIPFAVETTDGQRFEVDLRLHRGTDA